MATLSLRGSAKRCVKALLAKRGLAITRIGAASSTPSGGYLPAKETVSAAEREGLSVCDYVETLFDTQGTAQSVIDHLASSGAFAFESPNIVEIGTGTGRYLEKVLNACSPAKYESYETAGDWAEWLQSTYPIVSREADGVSLSETPADSVDLLHAHGVFIYLPFLVTYRYWMEIWRVVRAGGICAFDIISEDCLDEKAVHEWLSLGLDVLWPRFCSESYVVSLFEQHGFSLVRSFVTRYGERRNHYLVFTRGRAREDGDARETDCALLQQA